MEKEKENKDKNMEQQNHKGNENFHALTKKNEEKRKQNNNDKRKQKQTEQLMEQERHTQRKKNKNTQEEKNNKKAWKLDDSLNKQASEQFQELTHQTGILNKIHHNSFTNLSMQKNNEGN